MKQQAHIQNGIPSTLTMLLAVLLLAIAPSVSAEEKAIGATFDNLVQVKDAKVSMAYIDPDADFSVFKRVDIVDPMVAFRKNWQRDQNRSGTQRVSAKDMERIKADVAALFEQVFTEHLEAAGFEVVDTAADDVRVLRPAIIDLDITAPDTLSAGRSRTFTTTTGAATIYIQLFDSVTGHIIGHAADRKVVRHGAGSVTWSNSVTNSADARRMMGGWASLLVDFLQRQHQQAASS
jgi:hypothetical protein